MTANQRLSRKEKGNGERGERRGKLGAGAAVKDMFSILIVVMVSDIYIYKKFLKLCALNTCSPLSVTYTSIKDFLVK